MAAEKSDAEVQQAAAREARRPSMKTASARRKTHIIRPTLNNANEFKTSPRAT